MIIRLVYSAMVGRLLPLLLTLILTACGGGSSAPGGESGSEPIFGADEEGAGYIGAASCLGCHQEYTPAAAAGYLGSRHAAPGEVDAASGDCLECHDPLGDGRMLAPWFAADMIPAAGMAAVGCENCHGAGPAHLAMIPGHPNPAPDYNVCGKCHTALPPSGSGGHAGVYANNIIEHYRAGAHAGSKAVFPWAMCARCHTDEGFRRYFSETGGMDGAALLTALGDASPLATVSVVQCRTCHDGHSGELRGKPTMVVEGGVERVKFSRQFNLCAGCHQLFLRAVQESGSTTYDYSLDTALIPFHGELDSSGRPLPGDRVIWDSHFAASEWGISGYGLDPAAERVCTICHNPHRN